jgi:hypothetical protein
MTRPTELDFELVVVRSTDPFVPEAGVAQLRRQGMPWPLHVEIGESFLNWADMSAWVERLNDGSVELRPADGPKARYRRSHLTTAGRQHYDLAAVDGQPVSLGT